MDFLETKLKQEIDEDNDDNVDQNEDGRPIKLVTSKPYRADAVIVRLCHSMDLIAVAGKGVMFFFYLPLVFTSAIIISI
jgi:hypothetical protein